MEAPSRSPRSSSPWYVCFFNLVWFWLNLKAENTRNTNVLKNWENIGETHHNHPQNVDIMFHFIQKEIKKKRLYLILTYHINQNYQSTYVGLVSDSMVLWPQNVDSKLSPPWDFNLAMHKLGESRANDELIFLGYDIIDGEIKIILGFIFYL